MNTQEKRLLFTLAALNFTHIMDFMIMMPLGPQLMELFQITPQQFSFAVSAYSIMAGISGFVAAFFVDRFDRKQLLLFAYIGFLVGTFACAFAPTYGLLVAARVLAGLFGGMIGAQVLSIVSDTFQYERRGNAMGILMTAFSLASVAGVPSGLWLASTFSWHIPFVAIGLIGFGVIACIVFFIPPMKDHIAREDAPTSGPLHVLTDILRTPNQLRALALSSVLMLGHFAIIPFITPALVGNIGFKQDQIFLIYLVGGLLTIFSSRLVGQWADKHGKLLVFRIVAIASLVPIFLITNIWPMPMWAVLAIAGVFFITANGRMIPTQALVSGVAPPQQRGSFMSINSSVQQLASGLSANVGGWLVAEGAHGRIEHYDHVGYFSIALILCAVYLAGRVKPVG